MLLKRALSGPTLGVLCIVFATLCFAFQGIVIKGLLKSGTSIQAMLFWRQVMFWPLYLLYLLHFGRSSLRWIGAKDAGIVMLVGVLGFFAIPITNFTTLDRLEAGIERILIYSYPIFVVLFEALYRRRWPAPKFVLAFFAIQAGIFLLVGGGDAMESLLYNIGPAAQVLLAAVQFGLYTLLLRPWAMRLGSNCYFLYAISGSFLAITANYLWREDFTVPQGHAVWMIFVMMLISFPPSILFAEGVKRIGGARASFISTLGPVVTVFAAERLLGEHLSAAQLVGGAVVLFTIGSLEAAAVRQILKSIGRFRIANSPKSG